MDMTHKGKSKTGRFNYLKRSDAKLRKYQRASKKETEKQERRRLKVHDYGYDKQAYDGSQNEEQEVD